VIDDRLYEQFRDIGRDIFLSGLISSHAGNISVRVGDKIVIKRRGAMLGRLKPEDLIETALERNDSGVILASTELIVHRAIYLATPALAIVHTHSRTAIALSLSRDEIIPVDNEASYNLKKAPVLQVEFASGTKEMADVVANALKEYKIVMLRGHGSFGIGQTLEEAFHWTTMLEEACDIILETKLINEPFIQYRKMADEYGKW
jgi:L-fuculose-phosphate aldolase